MGEGGQTGRQARFGLLLATLIVAYLISALTSDQAGRAVQVILFVVAALLGLWRASLPRRVKALVMWVALGGSVVVATMTALSSGAAARGAASIWTGLLLLLTVVIIVERVLRLDAVTIQSIYGALSAYLVIGLMFASFFAATDSVTGADFFADGEPANTQTFQYFSFTTLTTLGYGDFTAAGSFGRAVAVLEALTGQVFLATLVARLVSAYRGTAGRNPPPEDPPAADGEGKIPR
jgi:hypothetical protein